MTEGATPISPENPHWNTYHASLCGLIVDGSRFGRFSRCGHLQIYGPDGPVNVSIVSSTLAWPVEQLSDFRVAFEPKHRKLKNYHSTDGLGVPIVAFRKKPSSLQEESVERFFPPCLPVAATVLLRTQDRFPCDDPSPASSEFVLELDDPLQVESVAVGRQIVPMATDISAPFEYLLANRPTDPLSGFLFPAAGTQDDGLRWLQPYQPGKIPVVLIHGLLSDPTTWFDMVNDLRTQGWFNDRYQVWGFSYATGSPFVTSAMRLRIQSGEVLEIVDPECKDPALRRMVLIGHSMGGLIAKLQVADSGEEIWNSVSRVPLESVRASEETKQLMAERLFFSPQPFVRRVIYIATPHAGSSLASRGLGRVSSALVRPDEEKEALHRQLILDNPGAFTGTFRKRIPTSVDLLEPNDQSLQAIYDLCVPTSVTQHTILGTGKWPLTLGLSDGVVPVYSAEHPCVSSERRVAASHTKILRHDEATSEVVRILLMHLDELLHLDECHPQTPRKTASVQAVEGVREFSTLKWQNSRASEFAELSPSP